MAPRPKAKPTDVTPNDVVTVIGPPAGRRRAGMRFGPEPVTIPVADLTGEQLAALMGDPALVVSIDAAPDDKTDEPQT
jgi:hypothetical protein